MKCNLFPPIAVAAFALLNFQCARQTEPNQQAAVAKPEPAPATHPEPAPPAAQAPAPVQQPTPVQPASAQQNAASSTPPPASPVAAPPAGAPGAPDAPSGSTPAPAAVKQEPPAPPPPPKPKTATLPAGTTISVRTIETLSTKTVQTGTKFSATLEEPIVAPDGWTIAKKGGAVAGRVTSADPGGRVKGVASMSLQVTSIAGADGKKISLTTGPYVAEAKSTKGRDVKRGAITTGVGAAIGAIAGGGKGAAIGAGVGAGAGVATAVATKGDPAVVATETVLRFQLTAPVTVTQDSNRITSKDIE